jgi:uncharacterized protein
MNIRFRIFLPAFLFLAFLLVPSAFGVRPAIPEKPSNYVVDLAGIVDDAVETRLDNYLRELEQKTTAQVVVLTLTSLEGEALEDFSIRTAHNQWQLGQKGKDNGVLFTVSLNDRKYRLEVGYGLEGILPDSLVGSIGREYAVPNFQKGDYTSGIYAATLAVANIIASDQGVEIAGMPKMQPARSGRARREVGIFDTILTIVILIGAVILFIRHPRLLLFLLLFSSMGGGRRSGWGGGGGFGGGGSFGGGGGGGFGGGGASGGW